MKGGSVVHFVLGGDLTLLKVPVLRVCLLWKWTDQGGLYFQG